MGATSTYAFRYPELTDAPNGPLAYQNLASDVEDEFNRRGVVGRNQRTTDKTAITTNTLILSTIASVVAGHSYKVWTQFESYKDATTATDVLSQHEFRYTTNNTEPTTTSTQLTRAVQYHKVQATPETVTVEGLFVCTSTGTFRVALCTQRVVGTGNIIVASSATVPCALVVEDIGITRSVSGTVY